MDCQTNAKNEILKLMGVIGWSSFLMAGIATMVFFAMFNPEQLVQVATWPMPIPAPLGYTLGFFGFWALALTSNTLSLFLLRYPNKVQRHEYCKRQVNPNISS